MKKLTLNPKAINKGGVLTRNQLKKITGGDGAGFSGGDTYCFYSCHYSNGTVAPGKGDRCKSDLDCVSSIAACDDRYGTAHAVTWDCTAIYT